MSSRQVFSNAEKLCLQELILKYKLNSTATIGAGNPAAKKIAWARLTTEYNSIASNITRSEAQLKKCWDNLKTRRKQSLALEKRDRMRTGGGPYCQPSTSTLDEALLEGTDIELRQAIDSDFFRDQEELCLAEVAIEEEVLSEEPAAEFVTDQRQASEVHPRAQGRSVDQESILEISGLLNNETPSQASGQSQAVVSQRPRGQNSRAQAATGRRSGSRLSECDGTSTQVAGRSVDQESILEISGLLNNETPSQASGQSQAVVSQRPRGQNSRAQAATGRRSGSRLSECDGTSTQVAGPRNVRAHVITEEFALRQQKYKESHEREQELHKLKLAEGEWLVKAAEETFKKERTKRETAEVDKESAQEVLLCNKIKREVAELQLARLKQNV